MFTNSKMNTEEPDEEGNQVTQLVAMSLAMFVGAFVSGYIPMCLQKSSSASSMRIVTALGAGVLIGAALIVIIPEGITMYLASLKDHEHTEGAEEHESTGEQVHDHDHHHHHSHGHHSAIGAALATGFAFMLVVDKLSDGYGHAHSNPGAPQKVSDQSRETQSVGRSSSAMLGLIVHAAIDGVALGASSFSGDGDASALIFLAIMLHKAPASFGLTTYLASIKMNKRDMMQQLFIFSIAAPIGAFATFAAMDLHIMQYKQQTLALVMLFSGGTFLFVATAHILPEVMHSDHGLSWKEIWVTVCGTLLPLLMNFEHGHGH